LLLGVFASMTWRNGSANGTPRPLHASQLPALSYLPVSAPVSRPPVTARPAFTLTASRPTWLRLTVDGKRGAGFVLAPGAPHRVDAQRDLTIRTGDAGAISVSVAGRPAAVMGSNGRVMSRQYVLPGSTTEEHAEPTTTTGTPSRTASLAAALSPEPVRVVPQPSPPLRLAVAPTTVRPVVLPPAAPAASARGTQAASDSDQITTAARRWLAAYTGGDRRAVADLTAPGFELLDERPDPARFAATQQAERSLANAEVSVSGDGAVLSARLIERLSANDGSPDRTAYMSQVWIRQAGSWRLLGVRIRSADQVERMFKR
jgi:ketosteroid isomerase-like protein